MEMTRELVDGIPVITMAESVEIDLGNCEQFKRAFVDLLEESDRQVVLDASKIAFFDSAGMGGLLSLQKTLKQRDGQLVIAGLNRSVIEVFRMVGFDMVFATHPTLDSAIGSFK